MCILARKGHGHLELVVLLVNTFVQRLCVQEPVRDVEDHLVREDVCHDLRQDAAATRYGRRRDARCETLEHGRPEPSQRKYNCEKSKLIVNNCSQQPAQLSRWYPSRLDLISADELGGVALDGQQWE